MKPEDTTQVPPVTVAVDGSEESCHALRWAAEQAQVIGTYLRVVTCYSHQYAGGKASRVAWDRFASTKNEATAVAQAAIKKVLGTLDIEHVVTLGPVEAALIDQGADASMIVVGTRSAFAVEPRSYQSTTDRITGRVACPVVSIPLEAPVLAGAGL